MKNFLKFQIFSKAGDKILTACRNSTGRQQEQGNLIGLSLGHEGCDGRRCFRGVIFDAVTLDVSQAEGTDAGLEEVLGEL